MTRYNILDIRPDSAYDRITALAARLFQVPIAIISIVDSDRIWFKSHHGILASEVDHEPGLCTSAILQDCPYVIENAETDLRALANSLMAGKLGLRFYAAVPLITPDGFNLGMLCVVDQKPRVLKDGEMRNLEDLAALVIEQLERRLAVTKSTVKLFEVQAAVKKANLARIDFFSTLTHELRTPLNSMLGFAQLLNRSTPPLTPMQLKDLNRILKAGWHLSSLISGLHNQELIESGRLTISLESIRVIDVLEECEAMMKPQAEVAGVDISILRMDNQWLIRADKTRLGQAIIHLLTNAIQYNRLGGKVTVDCDKRDTAFIRISIKDTGIGLPTAKKDQLIKAFNRLGQETGGKKGAGGLVVTKQLVEMMGGSIGVESTEGEGSEFWIKLQAGEVH